MASSLSRGGHKEFGEGGRPRIAPYHSRQSGCASQQIQMAEVR
jgi:hypothetical protein